MSRKPVQNSVDREQHDLKSAARFKYRAGESAKLPPEVKRSVIAHITEAIRLCEDHGYGSSLESGEAASVANGSGRAHRQNGIGRR